MVGVPISRQPLSLRRYIKTPGLRPTTCAVLVQAGECLIADQSPPPCLGCCWRRLRIGFDYKSIRAANQYRATLPLAQLPMFSHLLLPLRDSQLLNPSCHTEDTNLSVCLRLSMSLCMWAGLVSLCVWAGLMDHYMSRLTCNHLLQFAAVANNKLL